MNGVVSYDHPQADEKVVMNGIHHEAEAPDPAIEELERELPVVYDGQVPLGDMLSRVVQSIYAELSELAETCADSPVSAQAAGTDLSHEGCQTHLMRRGSAYWLTGSLKQRSRW